MVQRFALPGFARAQDSSNSPQAEHGTMQSPLPDSSALEAGILEDERPSRLSCVQDNVRHLLRASVLGSVTSSPTIPAHATPHARNELPTLPGLQNFASDRVPTPIVPPVRFNMRPDVLPSPTSAIPSPHHSETHLSETMAAFPCPPQSYRQRVQQMAHQSALFNTRAMAALDHPDLSDPSLEQLEQLKDERRQKSAWKRRPRRSRKAAQRFAGSGGVLCLLASLLLAALVATYVTIATTQAGLTTTFHILFVLGICMATIIFAYSVIRLFVTGRETRSRPVFVPVSKHGRHRHYRHHQHPRHHHHRPPLLRQMPSLSVEPIAFVPPTPIPVHVSSDDVRLDPNEVQPTMAATAAASSNWDKEVCSVPNPPPAYGKWRGSVRADPELLHWQAVPSPLSPKTPNLPSPTYDEAVAMERHNMSPPSYMTRESPARQAEPQETRAGLAQPCPAEGEPEPEMVEVRGVGVGLAA